MRYFKFDQKLAHNFFRYDTYCDNETVFDKHEKLVVTLLYKAVRNPNKINSRILKKMMRKFIKEIARIRGCRDIDDFDIEETIYGLLYLYSDQYRSTHKDRILEIRSIPDCKCHGLTDRFYQHANMRDLILRILINFNIHVVPLVRNGNSVSVDMFNKYCFPDECVPILASIVRRAIEDMYPQCNLWIGDWDGYKKLLDRVYPNHIKQLEKLSPYDKEEAIDDILYGDMPKIFLHEIADSWVFIKNTHEDTIKWLGFELNPNQDIIKTNKNVIIVSDYDKFSFNAEYDAWIRENNVWKYQPICI